MNKTPNTLKVTLVRSLIGRRRDERAAVAALGLRHVNHSNTVPDNPQVRGQLRKISYLLKVSS